MSEFEFSSWPVAIRVSVKPKPRRKSKSAALPRPFPVMPSFGREPQMLLRTLELPKPRSGARRDFTAPGWVGRQAEPNVRTA